jgi:fibronectin-binding autotransporter adhesin
LIKAVISTTPPKTLIWVGNVNDQWDTTTANWKDATTLLATTFTDGDAVRFDDTASSSLVTVAGSVIPAGGTTITNNSLNYTFAGGSVLGTGGTVKWGTGKVTYSLNHAPSVTVETNGVLEVASGGTLGGGLTFRGVQALNSGTINGAVSVSWGSLLNNATIETAPGSMTIANNAIVTNAAGANLNVSGGAWTVAVGCKLVNEGTIRNKVNRLNVAGEFYANGTGVVIDAAGAASAGTGRLAITSGGKFYIDDSAIGSTDVQARLDLDNGSFTYIDLNFSDPPPTT